MQHEPDSPWGTTPVEEPAASSELRRRGCDQRAGGRRAFVDSVGIGPKDFARTVRLQRAVRRADASPDWSRVATDTGYYDQAHLIGEFRDLVGLTPFEYMKRRERIATTCP